MGSLVASCYLPEAAAMRKNMVSQRGFTIIELLVTLAVLGIVLAIAIPSFNRQIERNGSIALGEELTSAINFARIEAIKRRRPISICASNLGGDACGDAADWKNGWLVFLDKKAETSADTEVEVVLRQWNGLDQRAEVSLTQNGANINFFRFDSRGVLARVAGAIGGIEATAKYTGCLGSAAQSISVGLSGMVSSKVKSC